MKRLARLHPWLAVTAFSGLLALAAADPGWIGSAHAAGALGEASMAASGIVPVDHVIDLAGGTQLRLNADGRYLELSDPQHGRLLHSWILPAPRIDASVTLLPSGRVLIWGGADAAGRLQSGGLWFDPTLRTLDDAADLHLSARAAHAATVLTDGRVLFAGGRSDGAVAQVWDERTGQVSTLSNDQALSRIGQQAVLQADGSVRWSGGRDAQGHPVAMDAIFAPQTAHWHFERPLVAGAPPSPVAVAGSLPAAWAQDVDPDARLALRFNQPLRMSDLNTASVSLIGPTGATAIRVQPVEGGRLVFASPAQELMPDASYTLMIGGVAARSGKPLPLTAIDFHTRRLPAPIAAPTTPSGAPVPGAPVHSGTTAAGSPFDGCASKPSVPALCQNVDSLDGGIWMPGRNNTLGRWRFNRPEQAPIDLSWAKTASAWLHLTSLVGRVLRVDGQPVANVEVGIGDNITRTDANGDFLLYAPPAGRQELFVDGSTANGNGAEYGQFVAGVDVANGQLNQLSYMMYLPQISERDKIRIESPLTHDTVISNPAIPGLEVRLPAGTVVRDRRGRIVTELAIVPTPVDRAPTPVPVNFPVYATLEPGGAVIQNVRAGATTGARIYYPNYDHVAPGTTANFWQYTAAEGWRVYGHGHVTSDGKQFAPEAGAQIHGIMTFSFHVPQLPNGENQPNCHQQACDGAGSGEGSGTTANDPIDLRTGSPIYEATDVAIDDIVPLAFGRSYRPHDLNGEDFGLGTATSYAYNIYGDPDGSSMDLMLPNGTVLKYTLASGSGYYSVWQHDGSTTTLDGSTLTGINNPVCEPASPNNLCYVITKRDGSLMVFGSDPPNNLYYIQDKFGNRLNFSYSAGLLSGITTPSGRSITIGRNSNNFISAVTDSIGRTWQYGYDSNGLLTTVTYPDATVQSYTYATWNIVGSACGTGCGFNRKRTASAHPLMAFGQTSVYAQRLQSVTNRVGTQVYYNNMEREAGGAFTGRVASQQLADGTTYQFSYATTSNGSLVLVTQPNGSVRYVVYDSSTALYPNTDIDGYGSSTPNAHWFQRDPNTQLVTSHTDSAGRVTQYGYDASGRVTGVTRMAGTPEAIAASAQYDADGDLQSTTDPLGHTTTYYYTNRCLTAVVDPLGNTTTATCNVYGQPTSVVDPLGNTTSFQYAGFDLAAVTDPMGRVTTFHHDALGRLVSATDAQGNTTSVVYDINGRVKTRTDASGHATAYAYYADGPLKSVTLPNNGTIAYTYDGMYRLTARTDALGQTEHWTYNVPGKSSTYTDRKGQTTTTHYDLLHRPTQVQFADGSTKSYTYDPTHLRPTSVADSVGGTIQWGWDDFDRLQTETSAQGTVGYQYDAAGRRTQMTAGHQSAAIYGYDLDNRLTTITQGSEQVGFQYDAASRLQTLTLPNGVQTAYGYNAADQLTGIAWTTAAHAPIGNLAYGYDGVGRIHAITGSYDSQGLPAASTGANGFDANNRLSPANGVAQAYDADGNLTNDGSRSYVWDARNQLTRITQGATTVASFQYDAEGRRIGKTENGQTTGYLYAGVNAVQETVGTTINPILVGLGVDQRFARNDNGGRTYFLTDHQGSTRALTDVHGTVLDRYDYDPYGNGTQTASGYSNPYQYTGREHDASGLYYNRARYYNPALGRFIAEDPIGLAGGLNGYGYTGGDPIEFRDPSGKLFGLDNLATGLIGAGVGAIFGVANGLLSGDRDWTDLSTDAGIGAADGLLIGLTDGASLLVTAEGESVSTAAVYSAYFGNATFAAAGETYRQYANYGCINNSRQIVFSGIMAAGGLYLSGVTSFIGKSEELMGGEAGLANKLGALGDLMGGSVGMVGGNQLPNDSCGCK